MPASKAATALSTVLSNATATDLMAGSTTTDHGVIELSSKTKPTDAAKTLWKHNILGAPVWDEEEKKYIGFFDQRDTVSSVVAASQEASSADDFTTKMVKALAELKIGGGKEKLVDVSSDDMTISYLAARNPFVSVSESCSLADVCAALVEKHCHRVPIVDQESGKCTNIISQSALVKYLARSVPREDLEETLDEAGIAYQKDVVSIVDTAEASEAFTLLDDKRLSGIAVVDEDGMLVGNTSARDIKMAALDEGNIPMDTDILSYLAKVRQATPQKNERYPSCHVHTDTSVAHVIGLLAKTGYHRLFVVDADQKPVGVISVADIVKFAISK
eukprot:CAMPEP_0185802698 /NCGR_PEP_ID=MMETSP1322-20130828/2139_1 /TAXON_ID=265543 /ORGANISM="Minutocellus polymorphus, Strain RCC2270" /LENGTH=330 /DNA_ID=CAMNT_0028498469 /DNA_START=129 /DNA_END=1121 /DNA_ORIENTATION=-